MKEGKIAMEILLLGIVILVTSSIILILVQTGVIAVKADANPEPILNTQFIPQERRGTLIIREFDFCSFVDENFNCPNKLDEFFPSENVYIRFVVESSTFNNDVMLIRNYRILNPSGEVVLELDERNTYNLEIKSGAGTEPVVFADFFVLGIDTPLGEYTLEVIIDNPLISKKVTATKKFNIIEEEYFVG